MTENQAAMRAEILENLTPEQRLIYRKRKDSVALRHELLDYFKEANADDVKALIVAMIEYDMTGEMPCMNDPGLKIVFTSFLKPQIDKGFDNFCITCFKNQSKGKAGGDATARLRRLQEKLPETFYDVPTAKLIRNDNSAWNDLIARCTKQEAENVRKKIQAAEHEVTQA